MFNPGSSGPERRNQTDQSPSQTESEKGDTEDLKYMLSQVRSAQGLLSALIANLDDHPDDETETP